MSERSGANQTRATSIPGIERATGMRWEEWERVFEAEGAKSLPHPEIAKAARRNMPDHVENPDWWAQGIAIAYEQQTGLRVPGQSSTGTFRLSASRTVVGDRDTVLERWIAAHGNDAEQRGHEVQNRRTSRTEKRSFWRADLDGAGKLEVSTAAKDAERVLVALQHIDLQDGELIEEWRPHWKALLADL